MNSGLISVVISTRNRGENVVQAVESVLQNAYPSFEVVVVDQSEGEETAVAMRRFAGEARVSYTHSSGRGISCGRNQGVQNARGAWIAVTDDDCEVAPDWLQELSCAFDVDPGIGVVFGTARPADHDSTNGLIPAYIVQRPNLSRSLTARGGGIGACMAFRKDVWERLSGFDVMLGAGAPFRAGEELDFAARALLSGYYVYETPCACVVHHGFRGLDATAELTFSYWFGTGAAVFKLIRCGHPSAILYLLSLAWRWAFHRSAVAASFGAHASRWKRLGAFVRGMATAATAAIDRSREHFA